MADGGAAQIADSASEARKIDLGDGALGLDEHAEEPLLDEAHELCGGDAVVVCGGFSKHAGLRGGRRDNSELLLELDLVAIEGAARDAVTKSVQPLRQLLTAAERVFDEALFEFVAECGWELGDG